MNNNALNREESSSLAMCEQDTRQADPADVMLARICA